MLRERVDHAGDDVGPPRRDGAEQVAAGDDAHALVPRRVRRREVRGDVVALGQPAGRVADQHSAHDRGERAAQPVEQRLGRLVLAPRPLERARRREVTAERVGDRIVGRQRHVVARRPLEHRDLRACVGQRRDQRGCGRAASDHDDARTLDVEVVGPLLRVEVRAGEPVHARELGQVALVVAVVAGAGDDPPASEVDDVAGGEPLDVERPARLGRRPLDPPHPVPEPHVAAQVLLVDRVVEVVEDRVTVGDGVVFGPRLPRVRVRLHVGVGAHARIAEQVPRAADRVARLEHRERQRRELGLQVVGGADAGHSGTDDDHVEPLLRVRVHAGEITPRRSPPSRAGDGRSRRPARGAPRHRHPRTTSRA